MSDAAASATPSVVQADHAIAAIVDAPAGFWGRLLFAPVAAIRPFLFARLFLLLLGVDLWVGFIGRAGGYGAGGANIAHIPWLDHIQPLPTPGLYVGLMMFASFAAIVCALAGVHRLLLLAAAVAYNYAYFMSQRDGYQHHYLMGIVLLIVAFLPRIAADEAAPPASSDGHRVGRPWSPMVSAWAYAMVGLQVAIVYFWTAVAKLDSVWMQGAIVKRLFLRGVDEADPQLSGVALTLAQTNAWPLLAVGAIVMELALAAGYIYAIGQDRRTSRWSPRICLVLFLIAVALHVGIMLLPLRIGLFSFYMLVLACVYLLPLGMLRYVSLVITAPARAAGHVADALGRSPANAVTLTVAAAAAVAAVAYGADLPGSLVAAAAAIAALIVALGIDLTRGRCVLAGRRALGAAAFALVALVAVQAKNLPFDIWSTMARQSYLADDYAAALPLFRHAETHLRRDRPGVARFYNDFGELYGALGEPQQAIRYYKLAMASPDRQVLTFINYADLMLKLGNYSEAIRNYLIATEIRPDDPAVHYDLALALHEYASQPDTAATRAAGFDAAARASAFKGALDEYRKAVELGPDLFEPRNNLATLLIAGGHHAEAAEHLRHLVRIKPHDLTSLNNLAKLIAESPNATPEQVAEAVQFASRAVELSQRRNPVPLATLADALHRADRHADAIAAIDQALQLTRDGGGARLTEQYERRRRIYASFLEP